MMATTMNSHPTWERDFIKGLLLRRRSQVLLLKKELSTSPSSSASSNKQQPYIVGLVGMPGSGKVRYGMT
jgi:pantothenate kinase